MKQFLNPFSPSIYHLTDNKVSNHDQLRDWILGMYNQSPVKEGNFYNTGFTTHFYNDVTGHLYTNELFTELADKVMERAHEYITNSMDYLSYGAANKQYKPIRFTNMWFNVNPPGGYQGRHHHSNNVLAGTYYIDVPKDSGKIAFFNPNPYAYLHNQMPVEATLTMPDFAIDPTEGDLIIWPGWMDHEISVNKTADQNRITISFGISWV